MKRMNHLPTGSLKAAWIVPLLILGLFLNACKDPSGGALDSKTRTKLEELANSTKNPEEKLHVLAQTLATLLEAADAKPDEPKAMEHIETFRVNNEEALEMLGEQIDTWQKQLTDAERVEVIRAFSREPYARKLEKLTPRVRKRIGYASGNTRKFDQVMNSIKFRR